MFFIFKFKQKNRHSVKIPVEKYEDRSYYTDEYNNTTTHLDHKMVRLMELIGLAIDEWALEYHLENLPKKIIYEQAFDAMCVIKRGLNSMDN